MNFNLVDLKYRRVVANNCHQFKLRVDVIGRDEFRVTKRKKLAINHIVYWSELSPWIANVEYLSDYKIKVKEIMSWSGQHWNSHIRLDSEMQTKVCLVQYALSASGKLNENNSLSQTTWTRRLQMHASLGRIWLRMYVGCFEDWQIP